MSGIGGGNLDFLGEENLCGQTLLRIAARGSSIITELLRLTSNTPDYLLSVLDSSGNNKKHLHDPEQLKYKQILFNYNYLKDPELYEKRINDNATLVDIDEEFAENNEALLERFYTLFESIVKYHADLCTFYEDVENGYFIQHTIDNILQDTSGKQLMCETLYLYGAILQLMEYHLPGPIREVIVISHLRTVGEAQCNYFEEVCKITRTTGYIPGENTPKDYPAKFFARLSFPRDIVKKVVSCLQTDDIYLQSSAFPHPEHRSMRLKNQASILYILLWLNPQVLMDGNAAMREIVDKHFSDNFIIATYMGYLVDLTIEWAPYKAAKLALDNVCTVQNLKELEEQNSRQIKEALQDIKAFLVEGTLTQEFVLDNIPVLLDTMRKANVALRWRLLHRRSNNSKINELVVTKGHVNETEIVNFLLYLSQFEWKLKSMFEILLNGKEETWEYCKVQSYERMKELSEAFAGGAQLSRVQKDESLQQYFAGMAAQMDALDFKEDNATVTGRKIQQYIRALEEVEGFEQLDTNIRVKSFLQDTREFLTQMVRTVNIQHTILYTMENVSDFSYAWRLMVSYTENIHHRVIEDPSTVVLLRATFLKLASILDVPLIRINQCDSPDTVSVAEYYSTELVEFLRQVLSIIPKSVFENLSKIVIIQSQKINTIPIRIETTQLKDYAQLDHRFELSRLTHEVSVFTEGILAMENTLLGIIQVDPRNILEDGLRKELIRNVSSAMNEIIVFADRKKIMTAKDLLEIAKEIEMKMTKLQQGLDAFKRSVEYVQDYIDLAGLKMWQEELGRVTYYNIEQECNRYVKKKIFDHQSKYQNRAIPIPRFNTKIDGKGMAFMGRILSSLLLMTDPVTTVYVPECSGWFTYDKGVEICGIKCFDQIKQAISVIGLGGLDRLLAFRIVHELGKFMRFYKTKCGDLVQKMDQIKNGLFPHWNNQAHAFKLYPKGLQITEGVMFDILEKVSNVGQAQLLRRHISRELSFSIRMDANLLYQALYNLDHSLIDDIKQHCRNPDKYPYPPEDNPTFEELNKLLERSGMSDPISKIYLTSEPLEGLSVLLMFFIIKYASKLRYDTQFGTLVRKKSSYPIDGGPMIAGIATLLKQLNPSYTTELLELLGQFVRVTVETIFKKMDGKAVIDDANMPSEVINTTIFIEQLVGYLKIPREQISDIIPAYISDAIRVSTTGSN